MRGTASQSAGQPPDRSGCPTKAQSAAERAPSAPSRGFADKWKALHQRAGELARLADLSPEKFDGPLAAFPRRIGRASDAQRDLAWQSLEDIEAMMEPGLAALDTLNGRGLLATAPALALWREFYRARSAVMALAN